MAAEANSAALLSRGKVPLPAVSFIEPDDEEAQDVGNIVHLEHLNLEVPELETARLFYGAGLGLTLDPGTLGLQRGSPNVHWYNIGRQQFHIVRKPVAQLLPPGGVVGLVLPDLNEVERRLNIVKKQLPSVDVQRDATDGSLVVVDPHGVVFRVHASFGRFPFPRGIAYVSLPCHKGASQHIAQYYQNMLGALAYEREAAGGQRVAEVVCGAGSSLLFHETDDLGERSDESVRRSDTGWHVAVYVANFSATYKKIDAAGLINLDHPYRDKCGTLKEAQQFRQLRFRDIMSADGKQLAYCLNHEVRNLHHLRFLRPLYNWHGENFDSL